MPHIVPIEPTDVAEAGAVLARAFRDNPGVVAVLDAEDPVRRLALMLPGMVGFVGAVRRYGVAEAVKSDGRILAVSLSFPPGGFPPPFWFDVMTAPRVLRAGPRRALRFARMDQEMKRRHPHHAHWYLWMLGVEPEQQGKGLGSELLRALSARADSARVPCYLETDKATSVRLYEKHGYVVQAKETMVFDVLLWFMQRPGA